LKDNSTDEGTENVVSWRKLVSSIGLAICEYRLMVIVVSLGDIVSRELIINCLPSLQGVDKWKRKITDEQHYTLASCHLVCLIYRE
jgi:hypothetical protein